ncbi:MAG: hypothetical protein ACK4SZ_17300 [Allosphingosinicella sp.]|uniref:hypothetical protein n=1 Tax=Allosphingosinicella sp. TaxID=2823234 RepID=UPI00394E2246
MLTNMMLMVAATAAYSDLTVAPAAAADPIVCRREEITGSRVAKRRVCRPRSEWAQLRNATRDTTDQLIRAATQGARESR